MEDRPAVAEQASAEGRGGFLARTGCELERSCSSTRVRALEALSAAVARHGLTCGARRVQSCSSMARATAAASRSPTGAIAGRAPRLRGAGRRMSGCEGGGRGASDRHLRVELQNSEFCGHQTGSFAAANGVFGACQTARFGAAKRLLVGRNTSLAGAKLELKHEFCGGKTPVFSRVFSHERGV